MQIVLFGKPMNGTFMWCFLLAFSFVDEYHPIQLSILQTAFSIIKLDRRRRMKQRKRCRMRQLLLRRKSISENGYSDMKRLNEIT